VNYVAVEALMWVICLAVDTSAIPYHVQSPQTLVVGSKLMPQAVRVLVRSS